MSKNVKVNDTTYNGVSTVELPLASGSGKAQFKDVDEIATPSGTKSITANGTYDVSAFASAEVNVSSEGGGSGTSIWEGYQHTKQVAPIPYIIDKCEKATAKGTFTITGASKGTTELFDTGLSSVHSLVIMLKTPVDVNTTDNGEPIRLILVDADNQYSFYLTYSTKGGGGCKTIRDDGGFDISNMSYLSFDGGKVNVTHGYTGEQYSAFRSANEYLWFAW